jgi:hypothetical protein
VLGRACPGGGGRDEMPGKAHIRRSGGDLPDYALMTGLVSLGRALGGVPIFSTKMKKVLDLFYTNNYTLEK